MKAEVYKEPLKEIHRVPISSSKSDIKQARNYLLRVLKNNQANLPAVTS